VRAAKQLEFDVERQRQGSGSTKTVAASKEALNQAAAAAEEASLRVAYLQKSMDVNQSVVDRGHAALGIGAKALGDFSTGLEWLTPYFPGTAFEQGARPTQPGVGTVLAPGVVPQPAPGPAPMMQMPQVQMPAGEAAPPPVPAPPPRAEQDRDGMRISALFAAGKREAAKDAAMSEILSLQAQYQDILDRVDPDKGPSDKDVMDAMRRMTPGIADTASARRAAATMSEPVRQALKALAVAQKGSSLTRASSIGTRNSPYGR
jgi:hypothetical protein